MANIKISELNELYGHQRAYDDYIPVVDSSANETKKISVASLIPNNVNIIAVTDTAPVEYETGDKYYNTEENKVYTATSWGWENPETPIGGILYIILSEQKSYTYDWDNETLISVGGGGGGGIAVAPDEPEEDTKLYIESADLDGQYLPIEEDVYSTNEIKTNKVWIDGKPIYRKVIFSNSLAVGVATGVSNIENLWFVQSFFYWNDNYIYDNSEIKLYWNKTNNTILGSGSNLTNYKGYIAIEYTKSS